MPDDQTRSPTEETKTAPRPLTAARVFALFILAAFLVFILQNSADHSVRFLGWVVTLPFWLVGVIIFLLGVLVGYSVKSRKVRAARRAMQ
jgi:uncharacterized integral membrane protein